MGMSDYLQGVLDEADDTENCDADDSWRRLRLAVLDAAGIFIPNTMSSQNLLG